MLPLFQNIDKLYLSVIIFITLYLCLIVLQPSMIFDKEHNCLRQFGVGYKHTTVLTLWLSTILLAIFKTLGIRIDDNTIE